MKRELPGEGLARFRGFDDKKASAPRDLKKEIIPLGEGGGGPVGLIGKPEEWLGGFELAMVCGGEAEGWSELQLVNGSAGDVVALLVGGERGLIGTKSDVGNPEAVGEN